MHDPFKLGDWLVEPNLNRFVRDGKSTRVTPKTMELLLKLAASPGEVISREALLEQIWSDTHGGEEVLTRVVSDLRAALDDDRRQPTYVETIPKKGYRLIAKVSAASDTTERVAGATRMLLVAAAMIAVVLTAWMVMTRSGDDPTSAIASDTLSSDSAAPLAARQLTDLPGFESHADVSPDGKRVAFSRAPQGSNEVRIWTVDIDSGATEQLTDAEGNDVGATWSPDGLRLIFGRYVGRECTIIERTLEGALERELGSCGANATGDFDWSPDGEWVAFSDRESQEESFGIYLLNLVSGERRKLVAPDGQSWGDSDPSFSPDGRQVAFTRSVSMETQDVWRVPVEGGTPVAVTQEGRSIRGHSWEPEGDAIIVSSRRSGSRGLWRFSLDGSAATWLALDRGHAWRPSLAANGPLVFEDRMRHSSLMRVVLEGDEPLKMMMNSTAEVLDPQYAPDGTRVAFVSNRSGYFEIWLFEQGGQPVQWTGIASSFSGNPRWSPDGDLLVFDSRTEGQADLYMLDMTDTVAEPQRLTDGPTNDLAPSFSADGSRIYFGSNHDGIWNIWQKEIASGETTQVTQNGGYIAIESSDGSRLYYTKYGANGIFERLASDGSERLIPGSETLMNHQMWDLADDMLYLMVREDGFKLVRIGPDDSRELITKSSTARLASGLTIAPNGSHALLAGITLAESDLWAVDR